MPKLIITVHAKLRWLERVFEVDVQGYLIELAAIDEMPPEKVPHTDLLRWVLTSINLHEADVAKLMHVDVLQKAFDLGGLSRVMVEGVSYVITNGAVVTVYLGTRDQHPAKLAWKKSRPSRHTEKSKSSFTGGGS